MEGFVPSPPSPPALPLLSLACSQGLAEGLYAGAVGGLLFVRYATCEEMGDHVFAGTSPGGRVVRSTRSALKLGT